MAQVAQETHKPIAWVVNHSYDAARAIKSVFCVKRCESSQTDTKRPRGGTRDNRGVPPVRNKQIERLIQKCDLHIHQRYIYFAAMSVFIKINVTRMQPSRGEIAQRLMEDVHVADQRRPEQR